MTSHDQSAETVMTSQGSVVNENDLLTVAEATRRFEVSESTLRRLLASKTLEAVQRKGPKGDYWLIPPAALQVLGYRPKPTEPAPGESAPTEVENLRATLAAVQTTLEAERAVNAAEVTRVQETADAIREADRKAHAAEVERLADKVAYETRLREEAEKRATLAESKATLAEDAARLAATLAATTNRELEATRSRLLELEAGPKSGRWWKRSKKQAPTTPPNG